MQMQDILAATRRMEESGMTHSQAEAVASTIAAAVAPLATNTELGALRKDVEVLREDLEALRKDVDVLRKDIEVLSKDMEVLRRDMEAFRKETRSEIRRLETKLDIAIEHMATKKDVESLKVWLVSGLLAIALSMLAIAFQLNA